MGIMGSQSLRLPCSSWDWSSDWQLPHLYVSSVWCSCWQLIRWLLTAISRVFLRCCLWGLQLTRWLLSALYHTLSSAVWRILLPLITLTQAVLIQVIKAALLSVWSIAGYIDSKLQFGRRLRDEGRKVQESVERKRAGMLARGFLDSSKGRYSQLTWMEDMGSRMQKMWFQVTRSDGRARIMTLAPISSNCALKLDKKSLRTLNELLGVLQHPLLHLTEEVAYLQESGYLVTIQPLMSRGSLKDLIYQARPLSDWAVKYAQYSKHPLGVDTIASYGRQILETTLYLYRVGIRPLGHIQSGNIFVEGEVCQLGGYETRLLGYRTRLYNLCRTSDCSEDIDVVMFGCVIFEMACGYELTELVPGHHDYQSIKYQLLKEVLEFIFRRDKKGRFLSTMEEILALEFFQEARLPSIEEVWPEDTPLTRDMRQLIARVVKGVRPKGQPSEKKRGCIMQ